MLMSCKRCSGSGGGVGEGMKLIDERFTFDKYEDWLGHLTTGRHRSEVQETILDWHVWEYEQSYIVEFTESLRPKQVVDHFSKLGLVWDFYFDKNMRFCIVRVEELDGKRIQLNGNREYKIGDVKVKISGKTVISTDHWRYLNNPAVNSCSSDSLRVEANNESRRVTIVSESGNTGKDNNKLKGIFSEQTSVPSPISKPVVVIRRNSNVESQAKPSPSSSANSRINSSQNNQPQNLDSRPKKTKSKRKSRSKKNKVKDSENCENQEYHDQDYSQGVEVQDTTAAVGSDSRDRGLSNMDSDLPQQSVTPKREQLDFRGGFQVLRTPVPTMSSNQALPIQINGPSPATTISHQQNQVLQNHVHQNPQLQSSSQNFPGTNPNLYIHPQFNRFQEVPQHSQPQMSHRVIVPVTVAHVPAIPNILQRQRYPFAASGPPGPNNIQPLMHLPDPFAQQRYNQNYGPVVVASSPVANNQPRQTQNPFPRVEPSKYQKLFFDLINMDNVQQHYVAERFTNLSLKEQLHEFMRAMTLDDRGILIRKRLVEDIQYILRHENEMRHCKIYPFGSFITGLGDIQSDVDLFVDAYGTTEGYNPPSKPLSNIDLLNLCRRVLRKAKCPRTNQYFCNQLIPIREARVPILKLKHIPTQIHCDLSFENLISVRNSEMITLFMELHPVVKPLMTLLRYWGKFHSLTGSNSIKNYALNLLVLVYLANQKFIPSIYDLQTMFWKTGKKQNYIIDGWDTSFCADVTRICKDFKPAISREKALSNLPKLIITLAMGFFEMFGNADFSDNMVCTLTGEFLPKSLFNAGYETDLPDFLERYKDWSSRQTSDRRLNVRNPLCIQDPFVLSFNVGSVCPQATLLKFQVACVQTMNILKNKESYSSLLDAFCRLPPEVGDKKFMTLQERQKQTQKLIKEIKEQVDGRPQTPEETQSVAIHLRPIQEIVDKKTIELGKGWQSYQLFQPDSSFQERFSKWIRICQLNKTHPTTGLFQNMKKLWGAFVTEFFDAVWTKCFNMTLNKEHVTLKKRIYSGPTLSSKFHLTCENLFMDKKEKKSKSNNMKDSIVVSPESAATLAHLLACLDIVEEKLVYTRYKCSTSVATWEKRERLFNQICEGLNDSEMSAQDLSAKENGKPKKKKKEIKESKKKNKSARSKLNKSPLEIEEDITKLILESTTPSDTPLLVFDCLVKMDFSIVDELPAVYVVYEKDEHSDYHTYCVGVSTLSGIISNLLPEYVNYRLRQWFEDAGLHESLLQASSSSSLKPSKIQSTKSKSDSDAKNSVDSKEPTPTAAESTTADDDPDLLLPPSSDESDNDEDLNDNND